MFHKGKERLKNTLEEGSKALNSTSNPKPTTKAVTLNNRYTHR